jgi:glucan biosynthesis protein C
MKGITMIQTSKVTRLNYLDHMRGLVISFVLLQHSVQGYAEMWGGRVWFIQLDNRSRVFDVMFMWTDGFIMQAMFFLAGIFVLPSLYRRGWLSFTKEKLVRLGIPLIFGVLVLVPPLQYLRYEEFQEPGIGYMDYWFNVYLTPEGLSAAGFWFLAFLLLFTFVTAFIDRFLPFITNSLGRMTSWLASRPVIGYCIVGAIVAALIGYSDIRWGTQGWMGLRNFFTPNDETWFMSFIDLFVGRSNMLFSYIFFFTLGVGVSKSNILSGNELMDKASEKWLTWLFLTIGLSILYSWYNQTYLYTGAFSDDIRMYLRKGGTMSNAWPLIKDIAPGLLIRTTIHGFLCTAQIFTIMTLLYRFTNKPSDRGFSKWESLGACSYGMFVIHEPIAVWSQHILASTSLSTAFKMMVVFAIDLSVSWAFTAYVLRKAPLTRRIF